MHRDQPGRWIPDSRKAVVAGQLHEIKSIVDRNGTCLFVIDDDGNTCGRAVHNKCHGIPKAAVLSQLMDKSSGQVLTLQWGVSKWGNHFMSTSEARPVNLGALDLLDPTPIGIGDACVRWFACEDHDKVFGPIEASDPDLDDPAVRLLYMYRAALFSADFARLGEELIRARGQAGRRHAKAGVRARWNRIERYVEGESQKARARATRLGRIWYRWATHGEVALNVVAGQVLPFRSRLMFGASLSYGNYITSIVLPDEDDWHRMAILCLAEDVTSGGEDRERLIRLSMCSQAPHGYGVAVLEGLTALGSGAVAASPESYAELHEEEKRGIRRIVANVSAADHLETFLSQ